MANVADGYLSHLDTRQVLDWFELGGSLQLSDTLGNDAVITSARQVQGLLELAQAAGIPDNADAGLVAAAQRVGLAPADLVRTIVGCLDLEPALKRAAG